MTDLFKVYNNLFHDEKKWKYYTQLNSNPFGTEQESRDFIIQFIQLSGKSVENPLFEKIQKLEQRRIRHIISTFFLGTYIYYNCTIIKKQIDRTISRFKKQNKKSNIKFSFIWFLICLFHDLGYFIEDNEHYNDFDHFINGKVKYYLKKKVGVPKVYENTFINYFNYRLHSNNICLRSPDHGICGGIILFDKLNSILIKKQINNESKGLSWNKKLINIYKLASWVILSHNIFFIRKGDKREQEYLENKLQDLILKPNEKSKIDFKKHTFLYLFLLIDSIDPIKIIEEFENLSHFSIKCLDNQILIKTNTMLNKNRYTEKVNELKDWLIPSVLVEKDQITITIM